MGDNCVARGEAELAKAVEARAACIDLGAGRRAEGVLAVEGRLWRRVGDGEREAGAFGSSTQELLSEVEEVVWAVLGRFKG